MTAPEHAPLTEAELAQDSNDCFMEYIAMCREEWLAGRRELPEFFRSIREKGE